MGMQLPTRFAPPGAFATCTIQDRYEEGRMEGLS